MKTLQAYRVRGKCDDCPVDRKIGDYPTDDGFAQPEGVAKKMVDIWHKEHRETTGCDKGHIKIIRDPQFPWDSGSVDIVRPGDNENQEK